MLFVGSILVLIVLCSGQEHLTCLRTDDALRPSSLSSPPRQQGAPGKRGPMGLTGLPGSKGEVGDKGDAGSKGKPGAVYEGITSLMQSLERRNRELHRKINEVRRDFYRGYKQLDNGWIALFNGYRYKKTSQTATWHASRRTCQSWNADLVVYGVQEFGARVLLYQALSINGDIWIGLTDEASEGSWRWVNGRRAVNSALFWEKTNPSNDGNNEDCAHLLTGSSFAYLSLNDNHCSSPYIAVCEKPI